MQVVKRILIVLTCLSLVGCSDKKQDTYVEDNNNKVENTIDDNDNKIIKDIKTFKEEYESLNNKSVELEVDLDTKLNYLGIDEVIDLLENKTGIIYFGFPACPWCRNIVPILFNVCIDKNQDVNYFNPREYKTSGGDMKKYEELIQLLDKYLEKDEDGNSILYVPDVYFVKDGNIVGHHLGSVDSQEDPYEVLTNKQQKELYNIYSNLINKIQ